MRRLLAIFTGLALLLAMAVPASAKGKPTKPPMSGGTCAEAYPNAQLGVWNVGATPTLEFTLTRSHNVACFDVSSPFPTDWSMDVAVSGQVTRLSVMIRDSAPGDFCGDAGMQARRKGAITAQPNPWLFGSIPMSGVDACGAAFADGDPTLTFYVGGLLGGNANIDLDVTATQTPS